MNTLDDYDDFDNDATYSALMAEQIIKMDHVDTRLKDWAWSVMLEDIEEDVEE